MLKMEAMSKNQEVEMSKLEKNVDEVSKLAEQNYRAEVLIHQTDVFNQMQIVLDEVEYRQAAHDQSKLSDEEFSTYAKVIPQLKGKQFGSPEAKAIVKELGPALQHHYAENRHHPEHFEKGIAGMHLIDMIEMICDWKAVSVAKGNDLKTGMVKVLFPKLGITEPLATILLNTADMLEMG